MNSSSVNVSTAALTPDDYRPAPFWFLNHRLEKDELVRQLRLMQNQGIRAFFLHPRAGLLTPYGSDEWFDLVRFIALEAQKLGMKAWLYDEDPYPSGAAGAMVWNEHSEYRARGLEFKEFLPDADGRIRADLGEGELIEVMAVRCDEDGNVLESEDLRSCCGVIRSDFFVTLWKSTYYYQLFGRQTYNHYRGGTSFPHWELDVTINPSWRVWVISAELVRSATYRYMPDNLNPDCVQTFLRLTHERYYRKLGDLFGTVIPGIFTDETATGGIIAWTPALPEEFRKRRGCDPENSWHLIFRGSSEAAQKWREDYWKTVQELFIDSFYRPVNTWCREHHLLLCGHGIGEESPLATTNGMNIFALQKYVGIPGFDHITPNIPNWKNFTCLNLGGKLVASAAEQMGEHRVQSESFACNAFNFSHDGIRKNARWLLALGVNWFVPHGFHYSYDGWRKDDAGKSFFFQSPDYEHFHEVAEYLGRLGWLLGESRSCAAVCLLYPEGEFRRLTPAMHSKAVERIDAYYVIIQTLLKRQIPFELADEETLRRAEINAGGFRCGCKTYRKLLVPFSLDYDWLQKFSPFRTTLDALAEPEFSIDDLALGWRAEEVMTQYRITERGSLLYCFLNRETPGRLRVRLPGAGGLYRCDLDTGKYYLVPESGVFQLEPFGAALFERTAELVGSEQWQDKPLPAADYSYLTEPVWDYIPALPELRHAIRDWHVAAGDSVCAVHRYNLLREIFGTELPHPKRIEPAPIFDQAPCRPRFYPVSAEYSAEFDADTASLELLFESETVAGAGEWFLNGKPLPAARRKRVYDPWNMVIDLSGAVQIGRNVLTLRFAAAGEWDGLCSMVYIVKKS